MWTWFMLAYNIMYSTSCAVPFQSDLRPQSKIRSKTELISDAQQQYKIISVI